MRNEPCGHTYSKAGIMQSLRKKHEVKCPVPGCNKAVRAASLERDREKEVLVLRFERQTQGVFMASQRDAGAEEVEE
ncbi:Zinc finger, RING/FYVE/PHD-type [Nannochloropsis gaditana]|uniref:Zinc finger, RING/FYVE/PHD-type n=1 Tax=Nannochloropsis gaditana TaxID=72520 RepID=W7TGK6_9STRA|nr:Zinc finger, RING/FYVE/PHD-type [Nannochloropsis gaditana]